MQFPVSGVEVSPLVPVLVGLCIAAMTTPAGVSGAFLLLPFQFSVLGFTTPGVTATNLLYNVISTPGGILRYRQQGDADTRLIRAIVLGAVPGVVTGSILRVRVFAAPDTFKILVGIVLVFLGANLLRTSVMRLVPPSDPRSDFSSVRVSILAAGAGLIGGVYGVSGGSIIAPTLVGVFGLSVKRVASAALVSTLITSITGVASFLVLSSIGAAGTSGARPDWLLALAFGIGGAMGGYLGARLNARAPELWLRRLLGLLALILGVTYVT